jgi:hypothetical protein
MKLKFIGFGLLACLTINARAQNKKINPNDTTSNYDPAAAFTPQFYTEKGNEFHSANGEPGPKYWQNRADYNIKVALDTAKQTISGTVSINYINNSPDALQYLWLQLDQNTYKKDARSNFFTGRVPGLDQHTNGYTIESVALDQGDVVKDVPYVITDTRMQVRLPHALGKGALKLRIKYHYTLPGNFGNRTDYVDTKNGKIYEVAQWFPRMCVYDDSRGWDTLPFLGAGEFYLDYGDFDYQVTVPWDVIVAGSGELLNPKEVLTAKQIARLDAARASDKTVMIRELAEVNDPASRPVNKGTLTWHYKMQNTRDVALGHRKLMFGMQQG